MTSRTIHVTPSETRTVRPSVGRRAALGITTFLAAAIPAVWGAGALVELLTGAEPDHRFHQLTGQGVLLSVLWLAGIAPLVIAGWRGRRPSVAAGLHNLAFTAAGLLAAILSPGNGGAVVAVILLVTTGLLWAALPARPPVRSAFGSLDPVIAPVALLGAGLLTPFILGEAAQQRAMADEHAQLSHYFDMAWLGIALVLLAVVAATAPAARRLLLWAAAGQLVIGVSALALTDRTTFGALAAALGIAGIAAVMAVRPLTLSG